MKKMNLNTLVFSLVALILSINLAAQKSYNLAASPNLVISGTSSLHDWDMKSSTATGTANFTVTSGKLSAISAINITMAANTLKSGKNGMDSKAYTALKTDKFKDIKFVLTSASKNSNGTWTLNGKFTFAGTTKTVKLTATESVSAGVVGLNGTYSFNLTDYGIEPPKALAGTIKTGNAVKLSYNVKFK